jgi:branched-chain amino acid aminotransferase
MTPRCADEVFMSGTAAAVLAITLIDDRPVDSGRVGPITQRLYAEFVRRTRGSSLPRVWAH